MSYVVVSPERGNLVYPRLALRIASGLRELGLPVDEVSSENLDLVGPDVRLWVVNPSECALSDGFVTKVRRFSRPVAVVAEAVQTSWYEAQFQYDVKWACFLDIGFLEQRPRGRRTSKRYRFAFNGGLATEREHVASVRPNEGPIPWLVLGHRTRARVALVAELEALAPGGVCFLSKSRRVRAGGGTIDPQAADSLLRASGCYVWCSHHSFPYYESLRFIDAVTAGSAPCKIELNQKADDVRGVPLVYDRVGHLFDELASVGRSELFERARNWYLGRPALAAELATMVEAGL